MVSDLTERLRHAHVHSAQRIMGSNICEEAADEIERLTAALAEARDKAIAVVDFPATMTTEAYEGRGAVIIRFDTLKDAHGFVDALVACRALKEKP